MKQNTSLSLNKQAYPLMMHLSIIPKYNDILEHPIYNSINQSSTYRSTIKSSWCTRVASTMSFIGPHDDDSQKDD